ncbi:MAG TPA: flavodoxin domain-containing protein [Methanocella sp.]|nr:flavodoxin domain-containing protein [Methanocella sp.]
MTRFLIIYHSTTGNTKAMAEAIRDGAQSLHVDVELMEAFDAKPEDIASADAVGFGVPTFDYHPARPVLRLVNDLLEIAADGKIAVVFGSYGWSGQGVVVIAEKLRQIGFKVVDPVTRAKYTPSENELEGLKLLGKDVAAIVKHQKPTLSLNA